MCQRVTDRPPLACVRHSEARVTLYNMPSGGDAMARSLAFVVVLLVSVLAYGNGSNDILLKMSDAQRNVTLAKFMAASGERCARVTRNFYQGFDKRYGAFWNFTCNDG